MKFKDMTPEQQREYLKKHPNSKFGKPKPFKFSGRTLSEKRRRKAFDSYFWADKKIMR